MRLQAILSAHDLSHMLHSLTPTKVRLSPPGGPDRFIVIDRPSSIELCPDASLRVKTSAEVQWEAIGVKIPLRLHSVTVLLDPIIVRAEPSGFGLLFQLYVEQADFAALPGFVDESIVTQINRALHAEDARLVWNITKTLSVAFPLPSVSPPKVVELRVTAGEVQTVGNDFILSVDYEFVANAIDENHA